MRTGALAALGIGATLALAAPGSAHAAKKKRKCRSGRIPVTVVGHRRCRRARAALPRPRAGDLRLLLLQRMLDTNPGPVRDRRGRRAPTMKQLFRHLGPKAYGYMRRKLPVAVAKVDAALAPAGVMAGPAGAGLNCRNLPGLGWGGFSENGPNGMKIEVRSNGKDLEVTLEAEKDGQRFRIEFDLDGCTIMEIAPMPACPTAAGDIRGKTKLKASIKVSLLEDGQVAQRVTVHLDGDTKIAAKVGDDAKLDHMTIEDDQRVDEYVPALIRGIFGPMSVHTKAHRTARMNMRTGAVEARESSVDVDATLGGLVGVFLGGRFREGAANRMKQESDRMFAATLQAATDKLRERETAWQEAGRCADLRFSPASGTLKLAEGATELPFPIFDEAIMSHPGAGIAAWGNNESGAGSWSSGPCESGVSDCPSSPMTPAPDQGHGHIIFSREGDMIKATARSFSWQGGSAGGECDFFWSIPVYAEGHFPISDVGADTLTIPLAINEHHTEDGITTDYVGSATLHLHRVR